MCERECKCVVVVLDVVVILVAVVVVSICFEEREWVGWVSWQAGRGGRVLCASAVWCVVGGARPCLWSPKLRL